MVFLCCIGGAVILFHLLGGCVCARVSHRPCCVIGCLIADGPHLLIGTCYNSLASLLLRLPSSTPAAIVSFTVIRPDREFVTRAEITDSLKLELYK